MALRELLPGWGCPEHGEDSAGESEGQEPFGEHILLQLKLWVTQVFGKGGQAAMCWAWSIGKIKVSLQERNKSGKLKEQSSRIMKYGQAENKEIACRQKLGAERKARDRQEVGWKGAERQCSG